MKKILNLTGCLFIAQFSGVGCRSGPAESGSPVQIVQDALGYENLKKNCQLIKEIESPRDGKPNQSQFRSEAAKLGATHGFIFNPTTEESYLDKSQFDFDELSTKIYGEAYKCQ